MKCFNRGKEFNHMDKADMTAALKAASKGKHSDIAKRILLMDLSVMPDTIDDLENFSSAFEVILKISNLHQAILQEIA